MNVIYLSLHVSAVYLCIWGHVVCVYVSVCHVFTCL